jgi:hypothetical protein
LQLLQGIIFIRIFGVKWKTWLEKFQAKSFVSLKIKKGISAQSYFAVFIDNSNRKTVCRLYLNSPTNKQIAFIGEDKKEIKHKIESLDEIYNHSDSLINSASKHI